MKERSLEAPASGWLTPLEEVPDPVFAGRMLGDGFAIDPIEGRLVAPCDGQVRAIHDSRHAVTLACDDGREILMHVGLETVALKGEGFRPRVEVGERVSRGRLLLEFDLDLIARKAKSAIIPVILTGEGAALLDPPRPRLVQAGEPIARMTAGEGASSDEAVSDAAADEVLARTVLVPLAHGLHARPAARLAALVRPMRAQVRIVHGAKSADVASALAVMALAVRHGDEIRVEASGAQAVNALDALEALIASGMGELPGEVAQASPAAAAPVAAAVVKEIPPGACAAVIAAPGLAVGPAVWLQRDGAEDADGEGEEIEAERLAGALSSVRKDLARAAQDPSASQVARAIVSAHLALLDDAQLQALAQARVASGAGAAAAWSYATQAQADLLRATLDPRMAERAADLMDLRQQVRVAMSGGTEARQALPAGAIVFADELLPSDLGALVSAGIAAACTVQGGPTSHAAILAAAAGLPMLVAAGAAAQAVGDGQRVIVDGDEGLLWPEPDEETVARCRVRIQARRREADAAAAAAQHTCHTADGVRIEVFTNLGAVDEVAAAVEAGAEGCGLLRTEFLFLHRTAAPDEDEQLACYQAIADALGPRPLVVRTLDVGGDKAAPYLALPAEENPALGLRGVRISLDRPQLLRDQLRAILRTRSRGGCKIMLPMVAHADEIAAVREVLEAEARALGVGVIPDLGIMIETPAAAITADQLAETADFFSIGTNDLTQYVLAADRGNPAMAERIDALHPAVLRMIDQTCRGAQRHGRWVGVCGGLASEPLAAPLLVGLGVTELSAVPIRIPMVKATVRRHRIAACRELARAALDLGTAAAVRALVADFAKGG